MRLPRHGSTATHLVALAAWVSWVAAVAAGSAAAEEKRPVAKLTVNVTPLGAAAKERPLPVGAMPSLRIAVHNGGASALAKITLTLRFEGMKADNPPGWRSEGGALIMEIARLGAGAESERTLQLRVVSTPVSGQTHRISVEARTQDGAVAAGEANLRVADCAGAYRAKLSVLRTDAVPAIRTAAEDMSRPDRTLPNARLFPPTGARTGHVAAAEKLAAAFAVNGGADPEMGRDWFRFLILRWTSELSVYAGQEANPGLCAANYYQIAGYREGLLPLTRRFEAIHTAAANALAAARGAAKAEAGEDGGRIARRAAQTAGLEAGEENASVFAILAAARVSLGNERKLEPDQAEALSLAETAAWLTETAKRADALAKTLEQTFTTISNAHRESCVCAF